MEFDEVNRFLQHKKQIRNLNHTEDEVLNTYLYHQPLLYNLPSTSATASTTNFDAKENKSKPTVTRKPTLSDFVHKVKHQSSMAKFARDYKRLLGEEKDNHPAENNADVRIIDSINIRHVNTQPKIDIDIVKCTDEQQNEIKKKELKKVHINEDANQQQLIGSLTPIDSSDLMFMVSNKDFVNDINEFGRKDGSSQPFIVFDTAIQQTKHYIERLQDQIEKELSNIRLYRESILHYSNSLNVLYQENLSEQLYDQTLLQQAAPLLQEMRDIREKIITENTLKIQLYRKCNESSLARFERRYYNNSNSKKQIDLEERFRELDTRIKLAYKRHEIWSGIRDWGLFSILLVTFILAGFLAWQ
ncbi:hypothetical protein BDF20DRAFT_290837 [Mycotypha africana]|uniref:uncharacterized protein n=1 Tax=Mycotypha africana TaxID=64632 RepID=UPI0023005DED|nr:uncharacterized protein BDF20DRAFT_290837 [Mycotypha africana]KAI8987817.1 hypothetical protein BDF20DRAFT_290837 [Mycotypha africana]